MSRKGENIYKRKDNRWEARYPWGRNPDGTIRYRSCYGRTYREVKEKVNGLAFSSAPPSPAPCRGRTYFSSYCNEWLQLSRDRVKESTYVKYHTMLHLHVLPRFGKYPVSSLNSVVVEEFSHELLTEKGMSPKSVRDILVLLHSVLKYASRKDPGSVGLIEICYPKDPRREMRILTREEQRRFAEYLTHHEDNCKFGVLLALLTGLRIGELCALRWENVSFEERAIRVGTTMQRLRNLEDNGEMMPKTKIVISDPKSGDSFRTIPMTDYVFRLCRHFRASDPKAYLLTGTVRYMEPRTLQHRFRFYADACGLRDVHFHTLRHTFATRCVEVEFEIKSLSEILGHANPRITLDRYVHSSMQLKRDNMNKLSSLGY